jgi:exodeoxyribonuclease V gamma subunit
VRAERARGTLPPGGLADEVVGDVGDGVERLHEAAARLLPEPIAPASVDVRVALPGERLLTGTVPGVHGSLLRTVTYSRAGPRHRLVAWVRFLALTAAHPDVPFEAATIGRAPQGQGAIAFRLPRLDPGKAAEHLAKLVDVYDLGMREPLAVACKTSAAYAQALHEGVDPRRAAAREWTTEWGFDREDRELEHQLVFGGVLSFDELCARHRFDTFARWLWEDLLGWEVVG